MVDPSVTFFGPLDTLVGPYIEYVLLGLAVLSMVTRHLQHKAHRQQAEKGEDSALSRHPLHSATMGVFLLASFYYTTLHQHAGVVLSTLVIGAFITDFFEFEARKVEVREDHDFEKPKAAIVASVLVLLYAGYQSVFVYIQPIWTKII